MAKLETRIATLRANGATLPEVARKINSESIHVVAPIFWRLDGESRPFAPEIREDKKQLAKAVRAARRAGDRREIVAARAGITVSAVKNIEGKRPIYTGRGTKRHLG